MGELIVYRSLLRLSFRQHFQTSSPLKPLGQQTQTSYGDSVGRRSESLFKRSWSHDQDGHHAHIW